MSRNLLYFSGFINSKLFGSAPYGTTGILAKEKVTANFHYYCLTEKVKEVCEHFSVKKTQYPKKISLSTLGHDHRQYFLFFGRNA
jgi:hypothetical protein